MAYIAGISDVNVKKTTNANGKETSIDETYKASKFSKKYKIDQYVYPSDLQSDDYAENKVVFYINIAEDSKFFHKDDNRDYVDIPDIDIPRIRGPLLGGTYSEGGILGSAAAAGVGVSLYAGIKEALNVYLSPSSSGSGKLAGYVGAATALGGAAAIGGGYLAVSAIASTGTRKQKRLKTAIALHTPNALSIRYTTNWDSEDTAFGLMAAEGGEAIKKFFESGSQKLPKESDTDRPMSSMVANLALTYGPNSNMVSAATGLAANPRKEQIFKGVEFRTFTFDYQFFPRSDAEAANVERIIQMFKFHMHPEMMQGTHNFIYLYPSEFDIVYYKGSDENMHIHRHTSCVLVDMNINYTPNGNFNTFANGMPTQINITLMFKELALMDKDMIANGL